MDLPLTEGECFPSFKALEDRMSSFSAAAYQQYWKRDMRTIAASRIKGIKREIDPRLVYYSIKYCCIKGGRQHKKRGRGERETSTFRNGCEAHITAVASEDGRYLIVKEANHSHNHETSEELYKHLRHQRALPDVEKKLIADLVQRGMNKQFIRTSVQRRTGRVIHMKDIHNIVAASKIQGTNDLTEAAKLLIAKYGSDCHIKTCNEEFQGLLIATPEMRQQYAAYPEFLGLDATYKLLGIQAPVFVMHIIDGNGEAQIICVCLLVVEDEPSVLWLFNQFKELNPTWMQTVCIMADKDLSCRGMLGDNFPQAQIKICIFHALRDFKREVTKGKMDITLAERGFAVEIFRKMVNATSSEEFQELEMELFIHAHPCIVAYYKNNWQHATSEWTVARQDEEQVLNFQTRTNNCLECFNDKLKSIGKCCSTLTGFIESLFQVLVTLREDCRRRVIKHVLKKPTHCLDPKSAEFEYERFLTSFAFGAVEKQLRRISDVNITQKEGELYLIYGPTASISFTASTCTCTFARQMLLPCRHIFAARSREGLSLFAAELIHSRWTRQHMQEQYCWAREMTDDHASLSVTRQLSSQQQCFEVVLPICQALAGAASEVTGVIFQQRLTLLQEVLQLWNQGREVNALYVDDSTLFESDKSSPTQETNVPEWHDPSIKALQPLTQEHSLENGMNESEANCMNVLS